MSAKTRDRILSSIELALGFPPRDEAMLTFSDLPSAPDWLDAQLSQEDLQRELEALSARYHWAEDLQGARTVIRAILQEHSVKRVVMWEDTLLDALGVDELLREQDIQVCPPLPQGRTFLEQVAQAGLGITAADAILVVSGTILVRAQRGRERATSLLPPVHLAVVTPHQRLKSVRDLVPLLRDWLTKEGRLPSAVHLISGPSRTADIELSLVLGAHGPKVLHVLEVDPGRMATGS